MSFSNVSMLRAREVGFDRCQTRKLMMTYLLKDIYMNEWTCDHPLIVDVYKYLHGKIQSDIHLSNTLFTCYEQMMRSEYSEYSSLIWLASDYGKQIGDTVLLNVIEEIKEKSL